MGTYRGLLLCIGGLLVFFACVQAKGTLFDDITKTDCIPKEKCACTHNGDIYPSGTGYSEKCQSCNCEGGNWNCVEKACFGTCSLEGRSLITTFDQTRYNFHGQCTYTLAKTYDSGLFSILNEIENCEKTDTATCLKSISIILNGGKEFIFIKKCGSIDINSVNTQLPIASPSMTIFKTTSFYIIVQKNVGIQTKIQLEPTMQASFMADPKYKSQTCGEIIYTKYNKSDCKFHADCGLSCKMEWYVGDCRPPTEPNSNEPSPAIPLLTLLLDATTSKSNIGRRTKKSPPKEAPEEQGSTEEPEGPEEWVIGCGPCECQMPNCGTGYRVVFHRSPTACCTNITCEPDSVCVVGDVIYQIGDTYYPEGSTCVHYECDEDEDGNPVLTKVKKVCQELDISKCEEGTIKYDEDGCCQTCTPKIAIP